MPQRDLAGIAHEEGDTGRDDRVELDHDENRQRAAVEQERRQEHERHRASRDQLQTWGEPHVASRPSDRLPNERATRMVSISASATSVW